MRVQILFPDAGLTRVRVATPALRRRALAGRRSLAAQRSCRSSADHGRRCRQRGLLGVQARGQRRHVQPLGLLLLPVTQPALLLVFNLGSPLLQWSHVCCVCRRRCGALVCGRRTESVGETVRREQTFAGDAWGGFSDTKGRTRCAPHALVRWWDSRREAVSDTRGPPTYCPSYRLGVPNGELRFRLGVGGLLGSQPDCNFVEELLTAAAVRLAPPPNWHYCSTVGAPATS